MPKSKINSRKVESYIFPELENLKAVFAGFNFTNSLKALSFLKHILMDEIQRCYGASDGRPSKREVKIRKNGHV